MSSPVTQLTRRPARPATAAAPVTPARPPVWRVRLAAFGYASRITETPWDPREVIRGVGPIERYLSDCDIATFELRCHALETQTSNLGLHPVNRDPGVKKLKSGCGDADRPELPTAERLVKAAQVIERYLTPSNKH